MIQQLRWGVSLDEVEAARSKAGQSRAAFAAAHGFASWRRLLVFVLESGGHDPEQLEDAQHRFQRLACLAYGNDRFENFARAEAMLAAQPALGVADIWSAACVGDVSAVRAHLDAGVELEARGGYFDWPPLLYACYSRIAGDDSSTLAVAELLLERGADPNAHYMWGGVYRFTTLTGAFGHGESGPRAQPEHPQMRALAEALLRAGADPNDAQALYNRMFTDDESACLQLLLAHGLGAEHVCNWRVSAEDAGLVPNAQQTLQYQLVWAVDHRRVERARLLIEAGAELAAPAAGHAGHGQGFYKRAMVAGLPEIATLVLESGGAPEALSACERLGAACMAADRQRVQQSLASDPSLAGQLRAQEPELLHKAAGLDLPESVRILVEDVGFDVNTKTHNTALHAAAWSGSANAARALIELGAGLQIRDSRFEATPADWAEYAGRAELAAELTAETGGESSA